MTTTTSTIANSTCAQAAHDEPVAPAASRARRWGRIVRTAAIGALTASVAASLAVIPASGVTHAYNAGVKSMHFHGVADQCEPGQALPCTSDAGSGDSNVLYVTQSLENGQLRFNGLEGTSAFQDYIWIGAEVGATCRLAHSIEHFRVDSEVDQAELDGRIGGDASGAGDSSGPVHDPQDADNHDWANPHFCS
ncbi:MAG: hypothetical protein AAGA55_11380 [Planctomycetota bacterium]